MAYDFVAALQNWARQTIIFAIGLRTDPVWTSLSDGEQATHARRDAEAVCETLWLQAQGKSAQAPHLTSRVFPKLVFLWVQKNIPLTD